MLPENPCKFAKASRQSTTSLFLQVCKDLRLPASLKKLQYSARPPPPPMHLYIQYYCDIVQHAINDTLCPGHTAISLQPNGFSNVMTKRWLGPWAKESQDDDGVPILITTCRVRTFHFLFLFSCLGWLLTFKSEEWSPQSHCFIAAMESYCCDGKQRVKPLFTLFLCRDGRSCRRI